MYRGVEDGGKVAVFELTGNVTALGDGSCLPSPDDCELLKLKAGETSFITVSDTGADAAQYELDLKEIHVKATTASESKLAKTAKTAAQLLDADGGDQGARYVFDPKTGTLHKLSTKDAAKLTASARRSSL